jgi:hypothetical protein
LQGPWRLGAGGEVVEGRPGDFDQDSFDERLSILTPDAGGRAGHALTDEERTRERSVAGSERMIGGTDWTPQMKAPGWQEYGKLSYAGAASYTQIDALPALCTT